MEEANEVLEGADLKKWKMANEQLCKAMVAFEWTSKNERCAKEEKWIRGGV